MNYCLVTTGIIESCDFKSELLLLGPWCLTAEKNKKMLRGRQYRIVPSPWKPAYKIKEAADYCYRIYDELFFQLPASLNFIHRVCYPERYWRVLLGPWLLHFIEVVYDRYKRIEKTLELFPGFHTHIIPREKCKLVSFDTYNFLSEKVAEDYYNLKLFSAVAYELCQHNILIKDYGHESKLDTDTIEYSWRKRLSDRLVRPLDLYCNSPIVLADMYHLSRQDMFFIKWKTGFKTVQFIDFRPIKEKSLRDRYSYEFRKKIKLKETSGKFQSLLYKLLPEAIPTCYMENYKFYRSIIDNIKNIDSVKIVGSATGWYFNERFKFFASEAVSKGARLIDFQHGGGYGTSLAVPLETISLEKDIFYTWGWVSKKYTNKTKPLPSSHLSKLKDTYSPKLDNILFVSMGMPRYHYRFHTHLLPEDMPKYFEDRKIFFQAFPEEIRNKILYRPYAEQGWDEVEEVKKVHPNTKFVLRGNLFNWMQKVKLVIINHPHTSFIEALIINVPCIFYWDHNIYLMRAEAEEYFKLLRDAEILFKDPLSAAKKVKEIFNDPMSWWLQDDVQKARFEFCKHYAYARKDWIKVWAEELKNLKTKVNCQACR